MPTPNRDPRLTYASAPVNRRTAMLEAAKPKPVSAAVQARIQKTKQRYLLGTPMAQQLGQSAAAPSQEKLHPSTVIAALGVIGALGTGLMWRTAGGLSVAAAFAGVAGGSLWWLKRRNAQHNSSVNDPPAASAHNPFDAATLQAIDTAFEATAAEVSPEQLLALVELKTVCLRVAKALTQADIGAEFTMDDRMYVTECIRRYIPDTLQAYLAVPTGQRAAPDGQTQKSADQLLADQLALLQNELTQKEKRLHGGAVEPLLKQQRFLEAKSAGH